MWRGLFWCARTTGEISSVSSRPGLGRTPHTASGTHDSPHSIPPPPNTTYTHTHATKCHHHKQHTILSVCIKGRIHFVLMFWAKLKPSSDFIISYTQDTGLKLEATIFGSCYFLRCSIKWNEKNEKMKNGWAHGHLGSNPVHQFLHQLCTGRMFIS